MLEGHLNIHCEEGADFGEVLKHLPLLINYCDKYGSRDVEVFSSYENLEQENHYCFGDGIGSYTLTGIFNSLN